jgi:hypothetical protein
MENTSQLKVSTELSAGKQPSPSAIYDFDGQVIQHTESLADTS